MSTRLINISHLAYRALCNSARSTPVAERQPDGTWDVLVSEAMGHALEEQSALRGLSISDLIVSLSRQPADSLHDANSQEEN